MKMPNVKLANLISRRGLLGLIIILSFAPNGAWWRQLITIVAGGFLMITAILGKRE